MEHFGDAPAVAAWLEASALGETMRGSLLLYPLANLAHILGLTLFVGSVVVLDLRLLGAWRLSLSASGLSRALTPVLLTGLALLAVSGTMLFSADARPLALNPALQLKAALIALALANAIAFRVAWRGRMEEWDYAAPALARAQVVVSLLGWVAVAVCGRLIGYV